MVFNATFNNISAISCRSVLLVEETGVPGEKTTDLSKFTDNLYSIVLYRVHLARVGFELTTSVVIGTDCIGSYKSNYTTTTKDPTHFIKSMVKKMSICSLTFFKPLTVWNF